MKIDRVNVTGGGSPPHRLYQWSILLSICLLCLGMAVSSYAADNRPNDPLYLPAQQVDIHMVTANMLTAVTRAGNRLVAVGERGHIIISDDEGKHWQQVPVPLSVTLTAVCFPTPLVGWAAGYQGVILYTHDGGNTWVKQMDRNTLNPMMVDWLSKIRASGEIPGGTKIPQENELDVQFTLEDWQKYEVDNNCPPFMQLWFKDEKQGFALGAFGLLLETMDSGKTWHPNLQVLNNPRNFHYYNVTRSGDNLIMVGEFGTILFSADWGRAWIHRESPYEGTLFGVCGSQDDPFVVAYGLRGNMIRSDDNGMTWSNADSAGSGNLTAGVRLANGRLLLTGPLGTVFLADSSGRDVSRLDWRFDGAIDMIENQPGQLVGVGLYGLKQISY